MFRLNGNSWIAVGGIAVGAGLATLFFLSRMDASVQRAADAEKRALVLIEKSTGHERRANELEGQKAALEVSLATAGTTAERWRREAERLKVPTGPVAVPPDAATAKAELRSVGLESATEAPTGVALGLGDCGTVFRWGTEVPILRNKQIAQEGLIKGLDTQVGILTTQKGLSEAATQELRAALGDSRLASDQYRVAYESTDKALKIEKRWGKVKVIGTAALAGYAGYRLGRR